MALDIDRHKNILIQILKDVYSDTSISPFLGFKGGTAAYLFYELSRFSIDLDFDLLNETKEEIVFSRIEEIIKDYGRIKNAAKKRFNLFFALSYEEKAQNIKVEINRRYFGSSYDLKTYLGISMLVMKREDMFANKLAALRERLGRTSRDIYDVWFFAKNNWPVNKELVKKRTGISFANFLGECIDKLEKFPQESILQGMGELLDEKQKIWARKNLKKDVLFFLKLMKENEK